MGRYDFAAQNVHKHATRLLEVKQITVPPPWYEVIGTLAPSTRLVRPPMQRPRAAGKKASKLFKPLSLAYEEDRLRWEYFNDHPWELARPRVILENDGRDHEKWDWSEPLDARLNRPPLSTKETPVEERAEVKWDRMMAIQSSRPINGESVIQRQMWLMNDGLEEAAAYDQARKEFYRHRHSREVEDRVAKEEALATGAFFGMGPLEIGMKLEDQQYENWKEWAVKETQKLKQLQQSAYSGHELEEGGDQMEA